MPSFFIRGFVVAAFAFSTLMPLVPAYAAPAIDDQGAATLKAVVEDTLSFYTEMHKKTGEGLTMTGAVEVAPKGSYYEVKIPGAAMTSEAGVFDIGTVLVNATPEDDGDYRASIAVPNQIKMKDREGVDRMTVNLAKQKFSGIFNPALGLFTQADAAYDNVTATITPKAQGGMGADPVNITLGSVASKIAMNKDGDMWSGPQTTTVRNASMTFGANQASKLTIEELAAAMSYNKIDLSAGKKMRDQLKQSIQSGGDVAPQELQKVLDSSMGGMMGIPESATSNFTLSNLALDMPGPKNTANAQPIAVRMARFSNASTMNGLKTDAGNITSKSTLTGLTLTGHQGPLTGLIPSEASFNLAVDKAPFKSAMGNLTTALNSALEAQSGPDGKTEQAQQQSQLHMQQAFASLPALLAKAGTTITINDTQMQAADLTSTLDGLLTATSGAPYIFVGKMTLAFKGMDELITKLQDASRTANDPRAAGFAQMLMIMQMSGQLSQTPDGKSQRSYALELTQDGKALLNGVDMKAMLPKGAAMPTAPAAKPATP